MTRVYYCDVCRTTYIDLPHKCRTNKYNARSVVIDGHRFPSQREADQYREYRLLEQAGIISNLELQVPYKIYVENTYICTYIADFRFQQGGETVVVDAKGYRTSVYRLKKKLVQAIYGIEIIEV